jgi:methionyl-tRNA synthetase
MLDNILNIGYYKYMKETPTQVKKATKRPVQNWYIEGMTAEQLADMVAIQAEQDAWLKEMQEGETCTTCGHDKEGLSYCDNCEGYRI